MKTFEFKTNKGVFVVKDWVMVRSIPLDGIRVKTIKEEQASEIVCDGDCTPWTDNYKKGYRNYEFNDCYYYSEFITSIESLHSLFKSRGINLFSNPIPYPECNCSTDDCCNFNEKYEEWKLNEENTYFNPIIFKK